MTITAYPIRVDASYRPHACERTSPYTHNHTGPFDDRGDTTSSLRTCLGCLDLTIVNVHEAHNDGKRPRPQ